MKNIMRLRNAHKNFLITVQNFFLQFFKKVKYFFGKFHTLFIYFFFRKMKTQISLCVFLGNLIARRLTYAASFYVHNFALADLVCANMLNFSGEAFLR
jgi:hypothetical protein